MSEDMGYLQDAMMHLGVHYTPARILALCYGSGKTRTDYFTANPPFQGGITLTIEVTRGHNTFLYRQREDEPNVLESRAAYRGARWSFLKRYDSADEARAALLAIGKGEDDAPNIA
jgi:hypothetical protein